MNRSPLTALVLAVLAAGLLAIGWVAAGYVGHSPLALAVTLLIAACYLTGAAEAWRHRRLTGGLAQALASAPSASATPLPPADAWLATLPAAWRHTVQQRLEGERSAPPAPTLTPYLVGLLVLLGMLGTFLGMVVTLDGTVSALEGGTDLQAMRSALAAPVKGLGLAFGTSVAGVCASAMLGLAATLVRRDRLHTLAALDQALAGPLRPYSAAHRRDEEQTRQALERDRRAQREQQHEADRQAALRLQQQQAEALPALVAQLASLAQQLDDRQQALQGRLQAGQDRFHQQAEAAYTRLADTVAQALQHALAEGARLAGSTLQAATDTTLARLGQEASAQHTRTAALLQQQLTALAERQADGTATLQRQVADSVDALGQRVGDRLDRVATEVGAQVQQLGQHFATQAEALGLQLTGTAEALGQQFTRRAEALDQHFTAQSTQVGRQFGDQAERLTSQLDERLSRLTQEVSGHAAQQQQALADAAARLADEARGSVAALADAGQAALAQQQQQAAAQAQALQTALASQDQARLAGYTAALEALARGLRDEWQQAGAATLAQQQQICQTLENTARAMAGQAEAQARGTLAEIARLMQAAAEAPRLAADVIGQLRGQLSDSMARDNALLDERQRVLTGLGALLDALTASSTRQQAAVETLVGRSAEWLDRSGEQFGERLQAATTALTAVAGQLTGSAVEVASLGEAFGAAVQHFGDSSGQLLGQLQRLEAALAQSGARHDEQLGYYVAQAREIIDLSIGAQKHIVDELQQLAARQAAAVSA